MEKQTTHIGLLEQLQARAVLGQTNSPAEIVALAEIVNHNAYQLTASAKRIDALESQVSQLISMVNDGFKAIDRSLEIHDECLTALGEVSDELVDAVEMIDTDITGVYADFNEADDSDTVWERDSVIAEAQKVEAEAAMELISLVFGGGGLLGMYPPLVPGLEFPGCVACQTGDTV